MNWKYADGTEVPLSELTEEQLNECIKVINKRQIFVVLKLRKAIELEKALQTEAKKRSIKLETLELADNPQFRRAYSKNKELIGTVQRSLVRKENKLQREQE